MGFFLPEAVEQPYAEPPFEDITPSKQATSAPRNKTGKDIIGFHTIISSEGNLIVILLANGQVVHSLPELLEGDANGLTFVTLDSNELEVIVKSFGEAVCRELLDSGRSWINGMQLWYAPRSSLTIRKRGQSIRLFGLSNWSKGAHLPSLLTMAGESPSYTFEEAAGVAERVAWKLWKIITPFLPPASMDFSSPSTLTSSFLIKDLAKVRLDEVPIEAQQAAYECLHVPWVEMFQIGSTKSSSDYDLNSAYPFELSKLLNIDSRGGTWHHVHEYRPEAAYGFYTSRIRIKNNRVSPIRFRWRGSLFSPFGQWVGRITQGEINFIRREKLGDVEVIDGWVFIPHLHLTPFRKTFTYLLSLRAELKRQGDYLSSTVLKLATARACGKMLQRISKPDGSILAGGTFCPIYACEAMTQTKLRLATIARKRPESVISVTVDGLLMKGKLDHVVDPELKTEALEVPSITAAPLISHIPGKISQFDLLAAIEEARYDHKLRFNVPRRFTLVEALARNSFDIAGKSYNQGLEFSMWHDNKRFWHKGTPRSPEDLLKKMWPSSALMVEEVLIRSGVRHYVQSIK